MEKARRPVLTWPSSSPLSQSRASSDSSLQRSITSSRLSLANLTQVLFQYEPFMDNAKTISVFEGYLTTLFVDPGHDPVRLQCMSAPINFYVIADSVTLSCIPSRLHLSVLLTRYLQHGLFSSASTVVVHAKMKPQNEVVGSLGGRKVGMVPKGTVIPRRVGRGRR